MAFPTVINSNTTTATASSSMALNMPASIVAGRLLLVWATDSADDAATIAMSGWTKIGSRECGTAGTATGAVFGKVAAGSDTGTVTGTSSTRGAICLQIDAWDGTLSNVQAGFTPANTNSYDPPSLTCSLGAADNLWIACGRTQSTSNLDAMTSYAGVVRAIQAGSPNLSSAIATRNRNIATEDPGVWQGAGLSNGVGATIVVPPAAAAATSTPPVRRLFIPNIGALLQL